MSDFSIIGKPTAMVDAAEKTTGAGKYADDLSVPGMLVGKILHSPYPHARIATIDISRAEALDGVVTVVIGKDAPNPYGILPVGHDEHALALDKVRYVGDNVACVVAISEAIAEKALELVDVTYDVLPAYFDPEESMKAESQFIHDNKPGNLEKDYHHAFGDPDKGFADADHIAEARFVANDACRDGASLDAGFVRDRSPHWQSWTADCLVFNPSPLLLTAQAFACAGNADVADSSDQAACWRGIRRQE
jgi:CO/xanthine dehydrogenase Mo-binding subunit